MNSRQSYNQVNGTGLKVNDQLVAYATRFLAVRLKNYTWSHKCSQSQKETLSPVVASRVLASFWKVNMWMGGWGMVGGNLRREY